MAAVCLSACGARDVEQVVTLHLHTAPGCAPQTGLQRGNLELRALGDFEAGNESAEILGLDERGAVLSFPAATRAVSAQVTGDRSFLGHGERRAGGVDLMLWPEREACTLFRPDGADGYPGRQGGQALAFAADAGLVVAAGGNDALVSDAIVGTLTFDTSRGSAQPADTSEPGVLGEPRAFATLTRFGEQVLIAGGETPVFGVPELDREPRGNAEVFDPSERSVAPELIELRSRRTRHAAVELDDGRTLLIGGRSQTGGRSFAQYQLETVDPETKHADVAGSITARIAPRAVKLSDGRVFVGGGVDLDGGLVEPVGEWLSSSGKPDRTTLSAAVPPRFERAFTATLGGGVLAVGGCEERGPRDDADRADCEARCGRGCPPLDAGGDPSYDAWWIDLDGNAAPVDVRALSAPRPVLVAGSDGSPWLVAASAEAPDVPRLFRFDAWKARFTLADLPADLRLPRPTAPQPAVVDLDTFVWLDEDPQHGELLGLRLGTRSRYAQDVALVLQANPQGSSKPWHLTPSRPIGDSVRYAPGALELRSPDVTVHVTDTDFRDVTVTLRLASQALPVVLLGESALGAEACPWPDGVFEPPKWPKIVRSGPRAELYLGGRSQSCAVSDGRLPLALRAGAERSVVTELDIRRTSSGF